MAIHCVTRHPAVLAWLEVNQIQVDQVHEHLNDLKSINMGDSVIGNLPIHIVSVLTANNVTYKHLSLTVPKLWRGQELSLDQLQSCEPTLESFYVYKKTLPSESLFH